MASELYSPLSSASSTRLLALWPHDPDGDDDTMSEGVDANELQGMLIEVDIAVAPGYFEVVSYTWGEEAATKTICINGQAINIRENLHACLTRLRYRYTPRMLWVDALSISQTNLDEKSQQVAMIGLIFATAKRVLAWLGDRTDNSQVLFRRWRTEQVITAMEHNFGVPDSDEDSLPVRKPTSHEEIDRLADIWIAFLKRPYWSRTWIVQEVVLGKQVTLYCGPDKADWRKFFAARFWIFNRHSSFDGIELKGPKCTLAPEKADMLMDLLEPVHDFRALRMQYQTPNIGHHGNLSHFEKRGFVYGGGLVYNLLQLFCNRKCFDRRDRVYALLWLIDTAKGNFLVHATGVSEHEPQVDTYRIKPDYKIEMEELFLKVYAATYTVVRVSIVKGSYGSMSQGAASLQSGGSLVPFIVQLIKNLEISYLELGKVMDLLKKAGIERESEEEFVAPLLLAIRSFIGKESLIVEDKMGDWALDDIEERQFLSLRFAVMEKGLDELAIDGLPADGLDDEAASIYWKVFALLTGFFKEAENGDFGFENYGLEIASYEGFEKVVQLLIGNGARVNEQSGLFGDPLQAAAWAGHEKVVRKLLDNNADVNAEGGPYGNALQAASTGSHSTVVALLLQHGANVNASGGEFTTSLIAALGQGSPDIVRNLLQSGADPLHSALSLIKRLQADDQDPQHVYNLQALSELNQAHFYALGRCLIFLDMEKDVLFCSEQHSACCSVCQSTIIGSCYVCRSCGIVDVCLICEQEHKKDEVFPDCRGHDSMEVKHPRSSDVLDAINCSLGDEILEWLEDLTQRLKARTSLEELGEMAAQLDLDYVDMRKETES
jgi:hypothetical protein